MNNNMGNMNMNNMGNMNMNNMGNMNMNNMGNMNMNNMGNMNMNCMGNMNNMNNMNMNNMNMNNMNMNNMNNMNMNNMNMNNMGNMNNMNQMMLNANPQVLTRLVKEYKLCTQDNDLIQIGCNFGIENNNYFTWRVTMMGPKNTPYDGGLFTIAINFPPDYPNHGPEFKFKNRIYHLNVDFQRDLGHICINSINEWRTTGKVTSKPIYTVKQALFDIFCLFYNQGTTSPYSDEMRDLYLQNPKKFEEEARKWTQMYAAI